MKRVLVTGCAGMIGANFTRYLTARGYEVFGIDDLSGSFREYVDPQTVFTQLDLCDIEGLRRAFAVSKPDTVYHFAAYAAEGLSPFIRNYNYTNNVLASVNVINECIRHDVSKLVFTSSMAVYGHQEPPFTEAMAPTPADPYGIAKYAVEMDLALAHQQFGLGYTIVRPHNVVGKYQNIWDRYRNVIGIWIRNCLRGEPMLIFGDGEQTRAFSDVRYCLPAFERLADAQYDGRIYNIGADTAYTINEIAKTMLIVCELFGMSARIEHVPERLEVKHAWSDHTLAKRELGFVDKTDIDQLVASLFIWGRQQPYRQVRNMVYEIDKNLYECWR